MTTTTPAPATSSTTSPSLPIRWGILSTGAIAKTFARNVALSDTGKLVAVASRSQASADEFVDKQNLTDVTAHASYEALLADPDVDAVYIAPPHPMHALWVIRAAEAGKHILCEKPIALNHPEAMAMFDAAAANDVFLMEAFMYRCHPQTARVIEIIRSGTLGDVRLIQANLSFKSTFNPDSRLWNNDLGGGAIMDVGCYPVSYARMVAGAATGEPFADPIEVAGSAQLVETGVDSSAIAALRFPGDILAQLQTGIGLSTEQVARIYGTEGSLIVHNPWCGNRNEGGTFKLTLNTKGKTEEIVLDVPFTAFVYEADVAGRAIAAGLREAPSPAMTRDDTLGNMLTLDRWRAAVGLEFEQEKPRRLTTPVHGKPLHQAKPIASGKIDGLNKPVSRFIMGCDTQPNPPHAHIMFDAYYEAGGNAFDTAQVYYNGKQERFLGQWLTNRGVRDKVVVIGKGAHTPNCNPAALTTQLLGSLERLQTDHVDIYLMHRDNPDIPVGEFVDVLNEHQRAGRMTIFGVSNWNIDRIEAANAYAAKHSLQPLRVLSNNFSLARMVEPVWPGCIAASTPEFRDWLTKTQMPLLAWSSQARGFFTERADLPADQQPDKSLVASWYSDDNFRRRERAIELAKKKNVLPINIAAAYVLAQPFPTFALIGPRTLEELRTSLPALGIELTPDEVAWLDLRD